MAQRAAIRFGSLPAKAAGAFLLAAFTLAGALASADSEDERFLDALRQRRLFSLAESFCRERLNRNDLPPAERAHFTLELVRTLAAAASHALPAERDPLWRQARETAAEFARRERANPKLVLVRVQDALTVLAEAELARQEAEISAAQTGIPEVVRERLREAARLFEELDAELTKEIPLRRRVDPQPGELSGEELAALQNHVRSQLARVRRNQALCYPRGSEDRVNALTQALELQTRLMTHIPDDDPLYWRIRLDQIVCARLLEDIRRAAELLGAFPADGVPSAIQLEARAEAVRILLAAGKPPEALELLAKGRKLAGQVSPELDYAHLETYLALWRAAGEAKDEPAAADWEKRSIGMVRLISEAHGPYWGRQAELHLVRSARLGGGTRDLEVLVRSADDFYLRKQFADAVAAYENAAEKARAASDPAQAFGLYYKAALVEQQTGRYAEAAQKLQTLSRAMQTHPQAAEAHLLAAWNLARLAEQDPQALAEYETSLDEHLKRWPNDSSSAKARLWAGKLREHRRAYKEALSLYLAVSADSPQFDEAVSAAARAAAAFLAEQKASGQPLEKEAEALARRFETLFTDEAGAVTQNWTPAARTAALAAARLKLLYVAEGFATAGKWLEAALAASPEAPESWQAAARSLLVVALAGQPTRRREAEELLAQSAAGSPRELLEMLSGLSAVAAAAKPEAQAEIARLQLGALDLLSGKSEGFAPAEQRDLAQTRARALAAAGRRKEAETAFEKLARDYANDAPIQELYAQFLLDGAETGDWQKALAQWRLVAQRTKPHTERWYRAKYSVALASYQLGRKQEAAQLIRYLRETPPGLSGAPLAAEFASLLEKCEK